MSAAPHWVTLGRVGGVFGVKGWLKIQSYTSPSSNIASFGVWTLRLLDVEREFEIESSRVQKGGVVAKLRGVEDRDSAREWTGAEIVVPRSDLPAAAEGEIYWTDLEGLEVMTTVGVVLGKIEGLFTTGAHDVLVVSGERERLIPFVAGRTVVRVDLGQRLIIVDWPADY